MVRAQRGGQRTKGTEELGLVKEDIQSSRLLLPSPTFWEPMGKSLINHYFPRAPKVQKWAFAGSSVQGWLE
jgi:hypothetical protein